MLLPTMSSGEVLCEQKGGTSRGGQVRVRVRLGCKRPWLALGSPFPFPFPFLHCTSLTYSTTNDQE